MGHGLAAGGGMTGPARRPIRVRVNGRDVTAEIEPRTLLVDFIRRQAALTGTHVGCDTSTCGACTVHLDGRAVKSCTLLALQADGSDVRTIESVAEGEELHPLQRAFHEHHGLQCGYCTPGMIMSGLELLEREASPTRRQIRHGIAGNVCRCTGYQNIVSAIESTANGHGGAPLPAAEAPGGSGGSPPREHEVSGGSPPREHGPWVGRSVPRKEDRRFLTGQGRYLDDIELPGMLHAAFVRSPYAHARIVSIDASRALDLPGVVAVLTGEDVREQTDPFEVSLQPPFDELRDYCLAVDKARHVGEAVAGVVAETPWLAEDAADLVDVEYEPLPPIADVEEARREGSPRVHENLPSNAVWGDVFDYGDVEAAFAEADVVVRDRLHFHRFTSAPLETTAVIAQYDPGTESATIWSNNQRPMLNLPFLARPLRMRSERMRFICPDIGGGFGIKNNSYPYLVAVLLLARAAGRPVKWVESRTEHLQGSTHGNEVLFEGEMALARDGRILGVRATAVHDEGSYMRREPIGAINFIRHATVGYRIDNLRMELSTVVTTKAPVGPNRSYGKMQQCYLIERLAQAAARELGLDPCELRRRNFVQPEQMPYRTASGCQLDGGDYPGMLRRALEAFDYEGARRQVEEARAQGRVMGIGVAMGMDGCPINASLIRVIDPARQTSGDSEAASIRMDETGGIWAATGSVPQGQGFETTVSQLIADQLGVTPDVVRVEPGFDSTSHPHTAFSGTYASRFAIVGAGAVQGAAHQLGDKIRKIAAHLLEAAEDDVELADGTARVRGTNRSVTFQDVARTAWRDLARLPEDLEAGLYAHFVYRPKFDMPEGNKQGNFSLTYSYGMTLALVEVDRGTGTVTVHRLVVLDDFGRRINPLIVEGQIHGATAHQLGAALYEHLDYDDEGQLLSSSFKDYWAPTAADLPEFEVQYQETPSTATPLGTRGGGEGGGAPLIATVNAVEDALWAASGERLTDSFLRAEDLLRKLGGLPDRPGVPA